MKRTKEQFIECAKQIHGDKYDYSKVDYVNNTTKVCIICPTHGEFWTTPKGHLQGNNCPQCAKEIFGKRHRNFKCDKTFSRKKKTTEEFIKEATLVHGDKYDYSKVVYTNRITKVCIICPNHGEFWQTPSDHLRGTKCPQCSNESRRQILSSNKDDFIIKANEIFHGTYDYSNVEYINNTTKVKIICKEHGAFLCTPNNHLSGRGCPICKSETYVYENRLFNLLSNTFPNLEIIRQFRAEWLTNNKSIDFVIPKYNIAVEHQGAQHFGGVSFLGGLEKYKRTKELDLEKYRECIDNGMNILYFSYEKCIDFSNFFAEIITKENNLIENIKNIINNYEQVDRN